MHVDRLIRILVVEVDSTPVRMATWEEVSLDPIGSKHLPTQGMALTTLEGMALTAQGLMQRDRTIRRELRTFAQHLAAPKLPGMADPKNIAPGTVVDTPVELAPPALGSWQAA